MFTFERQNTLPSLITMTPDEIKALEEDLKQHEAALASHEHELAHLSKDKGKDTIASKPTSDTSNPTPSSFV
jgi:hypothetical protein